MIRAQSLGCVVETITAKEAREGKRPVEENS